MRAEPEPRQHYLIIGILSIFVIGATMILADSGQDVFQRFFGDLAPLFVITLFVVIGGLSLIVLNYKSPFRICRIERVRTGVVRSVTLAILFSIAAVIADLVWRFPENINVAWPESLLFYPVMGYAAEMVFHVIPLAILILFCGLITGRRIPDKLIWFLIIMVALLEPAFQLGFAAKPLSPTGVFTGIHVLAINLCQLYLFKRYDFVTMFSFRLVYYLFWHIVWGYLRIGILY